jgi:hypothetical protein
MTTKTKDVRIGSIKINNGGNNGLVVKYEQTEIRNNREFSSEFSATKRYPVHQELTNKFLELRTYLLEICNYSDVVALSTGTEITGVTYNDKGFVISGKMSTIGDKPFAINTPLITEEDGYPDFANITAILDTIYAETKEYMQGNKVLSDIDYVLSLNKSNSAFDTKAFESLPPEEQWKIASEYMEKNKCIVTKLDDLEEGEMEEVNVPFMQEEGVVENQPETTLTTSISDEEFVVVMEPVKESKAKKKVS